MMDRYIPLKVKTETDRYTNVYKVLFRHLNIDCLSFNPSS